MRRFRVVAFLIILFGLNLLVLSWSAVEADSGSFNTSASQIPIEYEVEFRQSYGFRSEQSYVEVIHAAADSIMVESLGGIVLTPSELDEFQTRLAVEDDAATLLTHYVCTFRL